MLIVSDPKLVTDRLVEYPTDSRFIKLPIDKYMQMIPAGGGLVGSAFDNLNKPQIALINAINDPQYRFVCAALARRLGKTFIANIIAQLVELVPNSNVLIMSPNYSLSTISFELQRKLIGMFELEIVRDNLKDRIIELSNGSTIRMGSISQVDSCVGRSYNLILFDEAALSLKGQEAFNISLRPTLDRPNSKAIFISTPRGKLNWFSIFYSRGFSKDYPEWVSLTADYLENTRMSTADVAEAKMSMSKAEFEQEYHASFNTFEGQIYNLTDEHLIDTLPEGKFEIIAGLDVGYRDPTAFVVIYYEIETKIYYIVEDYLEANVKTSDHAVKFQEMIDRHKIETIFIDTAAAQFGADLAYEYDIATTKADKAVLEGINYVQNLFENNRIKVLRSCTYVVESCDQYQWDTNTEARREKPEHNLASNIADAMRYAIYTFTV